MAQTLVFDTPEPSATGRRLVFDDPGTPLEQLDVINGVVEPQPQNQESDILAIPRMLGGMAQNMAIMPFANVIGAGRDLASGGSMNGPQEAAKIMAKYGHQPATQTEADYGRRLAEVIGASKLEGFPIVGNEFNLLARGTAQAMPAVRATASQAVDAAGNVTRAAGAVAARPLRAGAVSMMTEAINATPKQKALGRDVRAAEYMLDTNRNITKSGVESIKEDIATINSRIGESIAGSKSTISKQMVLNDLDKMAKKAVRTEDIAAIQKIRDDFANNPRLQGDQIPVDVAQQYKVATHKALDGKYGVLGNSTIAGEKAVARNLKEQIAETVPGIGELNAVDSAAYNALPLVERRALASGSYGGLVWLIHNPKLAAAYLVGKSPAVRSFVANRMNSAANVLSGKKRPTLPEAVPQPVPEVIPALNPPEANVPLGTLDQLLIPGSERIPPNAIPMESPLPVLPGQLRTLADQYAGTNIPIGTIEAGGPVVTRTRFPVIPPQERGLLSLSDLLGQGEKSPTVIPNAEMVNFPKKSLAEIYQELMLEQQAKQKAGK